MSWKAEIEAGKTLLERCKNDETMQKPRRPGSESQLSALQYKGRKAGENQFVPSAPFSCRNFGLLDMKSGTELKVGLHFVVKIDGASAVNLDRPPADRRRLGLSK